MIENDVDLYIKNLTDVQKDWIIFFVDYMRKHHSDIEKWFLETENAI